MTKQTLASDSENLKLRSIETLVQLMCLGWFLITVVEPSTAKIVATAIVIILASICYSVRVQNLEIACICSLMLLSTSLILIMPFYAGAHDITLFALAAPFITTPFLINKTSHQVVIISYTVALYGILWSFEYTGIYVPMNPQLGKHDVITVVIIGVLIYSWTFNVLKRERRITIVTEHSYRILKHLLNESKTAYLGISEDFKIVWSSDNAEELLAIDIVPETDVRLIFFSVDLQSLQKKAETLNNSTPIRFEHTFKPHEQDERDCIVELSLFDRSVSCPFGIKFFLVIVDVTDQKRDIANTLEKSERLSFISSISHELRNPLQGMLAHAQLLAQDSGLSKSQLKHVKTIERSTLHLRNVINEVLDYAKIESGHMIIRKEWVDITEITKDVAELYDQEALKKGLSLSLDIVPEVQAMKYFGTDPTKFRQVLSNLVSNAVKYTEDGWIKIKLEVINFDSSTSNDEIHELGHPELRCTVSDSGQGIQADDCLRIFDPFRQVEGKSKTIEGTGLGLPIARQYAKALGGTLELESIFGIGSRFILSFPLSETALQDHISSNQMAQELTNLSSEEVNSGCLLPGEISAPSVFEDTPEISAMGLPLANNQSSNRENGCRVLIVDDSEMNRNLMIDTLKALTCSIETAVDGDDGVQKAQQWSPDLIFMDLRMPIMNGIEATKRIRETPSCSKTRIFGCTASAFREDELSFLDAGVEKVIKKPFVISELQKIVMDVNNEIQ